MKPPSSRSLGRLGLGFLFGLAGLALATLVAELGLRLVAPQPISWLSIYAPDDVLPYRLAPGVSQHVDTGETDWWVLVDRKGYRAASPGVENPDDAPYLLGLGDSFAFGHGTSYEDSLYGILDRELEGLAVRNASVPGYGPEQYRMVLEEHLEHPGLEGVFLTSFLGNDFHDCIWNKERPITDGALGATVGRRYWIKKTSHLYRFLAARAHGFGWGRGESDLLLNAELMTHEAWNQGRLAEARRIFAAELERIRDLCRKRDVPLFVILLPARMTIDDEVFEASLKSAALEEGSWQRDLPSRKAAAACARLALSYFETGEFLGSCPKPIYLRFDGHFRAETTHALARAIVERFVPRGRATQ